MSAAQGKVIITCAVTGSIHTPTMSPHLPVTADEIAEQAVAAAEAGAAILHLHARDPQDGRPTADPEAFMAFLPRIKQSCDAVVNITTGGSAQMSLDGVQQAGAGFAAIAAGMTIVGAVKNAVNTTTESLHVIAHFLVNLFQLRHRQQAFGQARLIGGNGDFKAGVGQRGDGL